jgi:hypothetical protein
MSKRRRRSAGDQRNQLALPVPTAESRSCVSSVCSSASLFLLLLPVRCRSPADLRWRTLRCAGVGRATPAAASRRVDSDWAAKGKGKGERKGKGGCGCVVWLVAGTNGRSGAVVLEVASGGRRGLLLHFASLRCSARDPPV